MVTKLIQGLLKKQDAQKGDVPDELPPIKGDSSKEAEAPKETTPEAQNNEAPAELPDIKEAEAPAPVPQPQAEPAELPDMPMQHDEEHEAPQKKMQAPEPAEGFFSKLSHLLKSGKGSDQIAKQNLLSTMKESYSIKKEAAKTGLTLTEEKRVRQTIDETMGTLKLLEGKWRAQKMVIDEDERTLKEYEQSIQGNEKQLKKLLKQYKIYQPAEKSLVLKNYLEVKNISELFNALRTIDEKVYLAHTGKRMNDFADFVKQVDKPLGEKLSRARSKTGMIRALEIYIADHK